MGSSDEESGFEVVQPGDGRASRTASEDGPDVPVSEPAMDKGLSGATFWIDDPTPVPPAHWKTTVKALQAGDILLAIAAWRAGTRLLALTAVGRFFSHAYMNQQVVLAKGKSGEGALPAGIWAGFTALQGTLFAFSRFWRQRSAMHLLALSLGHAQVVSWGVLHPRSFLGFMVKTLFGVARNLYAEAIRKIHLEGTPLLPRASFPYKAEDIDAKWLSKALGEQVASVRLLPINKTLDDIDLDDEEAVDEAIIPRGFIGEAVRLVPRFANPDSPAVQKLPRSFVAKLPTTSTALKILVRPNGTYRRETDFYSKIAPRVYEWRRKLKEPMIEIPVVYASEFNQLTTEFCLLFADAAPLKSGNELLGASWQLACSVATRYARFHALHWRPSMEALDVDFKLGWHATYDWMMAVHTPTNQENTRDFFTRLMKEDRYASYISPTAQRTIRTFVEHIPLVLDELLQGPLTFIHADGRTENFLLPSEETEKEDRLCRAGLKFDDSYDRNNVRWLSVDWQTSTKGKGIYDLAYFVGMDLNVDPEAGDTCDRILVSEYYKALVAALPDKKQLGGYTEEDCWRDYRLSMFLSLLIPITILHSDSIGSEGSERLRAVREYTLRRGVQAIERLNSIEVLEDLIRRRVKTRSMNGALTTYRHVEDQMLERDRAGISMPGQGKADAPVVVRSATPQDDPLGHISPSYALSLKEGSDIPPGTGRRDVYDRWFLNGYDPEGKFFFAAALGVYPGRGTMDASFSVVVDGKQHNVRVSRHLTEDEWPSNLKKAADSGKRIVLDSDVGPIRITIQEPLQTATLEVRVPGKAEAKLTMRGRYEPTMEPPYANDVRGIGMFEYDRFTQLVEWEGTILVDGKTEISTDGWWGTRDRSWGCRPHGQADQGPEKNVKRNAFLANRTTREFVNQALLPFAHKIPQFYWFWTPINVPNGGFTYHSQQKEDGTVENGAAHVFGDPFGPEHAPYGKVEAAGHSLEYQSNGTRHFRTCTIIMVLQDGRRVTVTFEPVQPFFMSGIGYSHDTMPHGVRHPQDFVMQCDSFRSEMPDRLHGLHIHVQEISIARCELYARDAGPSDAPLAVTYGVSGAEQLVVGPHKPSGFVSALDA
ncbi:Hypothetical Protein FCC1311_020062 [Hondaea fermentalgiana]|uniref:Aminoglycoside phosphotransferase domain-containing protein n=1 Tax=Hondaea fermentalgiana TaxID=2315210 RepID=A0A2R5G431_9STRA|nr:Hypothetical Protein FCC1311_020062 [Hondaea fermentalgiana]|eukprot:GBG25787.1 Hypothetical Protein FCC1311_020062 [Hondaea fermentalgiana]